MNYILYTAFAAFISVAGYKVYIYEKKLKERLNKLENRFENLFAFRNTDAISVEMPIEHQLICLEQQAEKLKFCYQCPLYQDITQEGMLQKTQPDKK